jgi:chorismate synthase
MVGVRGERGGTAMLRYLTGGESHGRCLVAILEGMACGLRIDAGRINEDLSRRQAGFGRGGRMKIEQDNAEILSGVRKGVTIGSPIALMIKNMDYRIDEAPEILCPRPGHADLAGTLKYNQGIREVLERASARETAARVAVGAVCKSFLDEFSIEILGHVVAIGAVKANTRHLTFAQIKAHSRRSRISCADEVSEKVMVEMIQKAKESGDTVGGVFEIVITGVPAGLGSHVHWDRKISTRLTASLFSIQGIKGVEIGMGFESANRAGSQVHDEIFYDKKRGYYRKTNNAGGIEGGVTNGEPIVMRCAMKPISTLMSPLRTVDMSTKKEVKAAVERSDVCAVPSAAVVGEAVCAFEVANAMLEKFGGDSLVEIKRNYEGFIAGVKRR